MSQIYLTEDDTKKKNATDKRKLSISEAVNMAFEILYI